MSNQINGTPDTFDPNQPISARQLARNTIVAMPRGWGHVGGATNVPDLVAVAVVAELRKRVTGIKDDPYLAHTDEDKEPIRQEALNEVLDLLTKYSHPDEEKQFNVRNYA